MRRNLTTLLIFVATVLITSGCADDPVQLTGNDTASPDVASDATADSSAPEDTQAPDTSGPTDTASPPDTALPDIPPRQQDLDADTISNTDEGAESTDTDGDTTPDYLDKDTDNDGIPDLYEAGDFDLATPPVDSDGDGTPDFRDDDSDNNGIPDGEEGRVDTDGDGTPDFQDFDNDGDNIADITEIEGFAVDCDGDSITDPAGTPDAPFDCDGNGIPDYLSIDADGDGIADAFEGNADTDDDGTPDRFDADSDNDGISDADERGPGGIDERPRNSDTDFFPDFRDPDSDDDGISDADEVANGTNPYAADSDGDGVNDLIEITAGTNPNFDGDSPLLNGEFVFVMPYQQTPQPADDTLAFKTNFQQADVFFLFDRTGSMLTEVNAMRFAISSIIGELTCARTVASCTRGTDCAEGEICGGSGVCIEDPAQSGCIPSFFTGSGVYGGDPNSHAFATLQALGPDADATAAALPNAVGNYGTLEAMFAAVQCTVDPDHANCQAGWTTGCASSGIGCPGFREDSARILVIITDEDNEWVNGNFTAASAGGALASEGVALVAIEAANGGTGNGRADLDALAQAAGSLDSTGQPFVRAGDGTTVVPLVSEAIRELVNDIPAQITIEAVGSSEALAFLDYLEVNVSGDDLDGDGNTDCMVISGTSDTITPTDGRDDAFDAVIPGTSVCWNVVPKQNDTVPAEATAQLFQIQLVVRGDGATLDTRTVFFLVPPNPPTIN